MRLFLGPALRTQPDRRLVTLVRDGYEAAFDEIVRRYGKALGRYATAIVGGRSEEVTQDAFSKALLALRRESDAEIDLRPWLYRIVRNTALNDLRDRPPDAAELAEALQAGSESAADAVERREEIAELMRRLRALPEAQRAAIVMRELEGLGHDEIAAALGMSGGAARQAIFRARQALRDGLGAMIPLPLLRALIDHGVEAGAAAGAGGTVAAGSALGGAGAGTALKIGAISAAVVASGVGTGIALKDKNTGHEVETAAAAVRSVEQPRTRSPQAGGDSSPSGAAGTGGETVSTSAGGDSEVPRAEIGTAGTSGGGSSSGAGPAGEGTSQIGNGHGDGQGPGGPPDHHPSAPSPPGGGPGPGGRHEGPGGGGGSGPGPSGGGFDGSRDGMQPPPPPPPQPPPPEGDGSSGSGSGTSGSGSYDPGSGDYRYDSSGSGSGEYGYPTGGSGPN